MGKSVPRGLLHSALRGGVFVWALWLGWEVQQGDSALKFYWLSCAV